MNLLREFSSRDRSPPAPRPPGNRPPGSWHRVQGLRPGAGTGSERARARGSSCASRAPLGAPRGGAGRGAAAELCRRLGAREQGAACSRLSGASGASGASAWGASYAGPRERTEKPRPGPSRLCGLGVCPATAAARRPAALSPKVQVRPSWERPEREGVRSGGRGAGAGVREGVEA